MSDRTGRVQRSATTGKRCKARETLTSSVRRSSDRARQAGAFADESVPKFQNPGIVRRVCYIVSLMSRPRTIVGIGEALLCEYPDRIEPGGLAIRTALAAIQRGDHGLAISRVGQDRAGDELLRRLAETGLSAAHLQSDPD